MIKDKKFFQNIVKEIVKTAIPGAAAKGTGGGSPVVQPKTIDGRGGDGAPKGSAGNYSAYVKRMQQAMIDLASEVTQGIDVEIQSSTPRVVGAPGKASPQTAKAKRGFNAFITEFYTSELPDDLKGDEFTTDTSADTLKKKNPTRTNLYDLDIVMDTMKRIGNQAGGEFKPDGFWGFRTDNALRNVCAFTYSMLQLEGDFGIPAKEYTVGYWNTFTHMFEGYEVDPDNSEPIGLDMAERNKRAQIITAHLKAIKKMYIYIRNYILNNPRYRPYIEGKQRFDVRAKDINANVTDADITAHSNKTFKAKLPVYDQNDNKKMEEVQVPISALVDKASLENFVRERLKFTEQTTVSAKAIDVYNALKIALFNLDKIDDAAESVAATSGEPTVAPVAAPQAGTTPRPKMKEDF